MDGDNFSSWSPSGTGGTVDAAALIFFACIGFDAISTFGIWLGAGLLIYAIYGYRHSRLQRGEGADPDRPLSA